MDRHSDDEETDSGGALVPRDECSDVMRRLNEAIAARNLEAELEIVDHA